ncbi:MAG: hypothetical protein HY721_15445 [Planctomycetes bacterium]|nr:hypothetical protein [Planctomycetota bacterium]
MTEKHESLSGGKGWAAAGAASLPERLHPGTRTAGLEPRSTAPKPPEGGMSLERQLLIEHLPGWDGGAWPRTSRRSWHVVLGLVLAAVFALALLFFLEERKGWHDSVATLANQLETAKDEARVREEALRREGAEKERLLAERRAENQSLVALTERTLAELKSSLDEARALRRERSELEEDLREAARAPRRSPVDQLLIRMPRWLEAALRAVDAAGVPEDGVPERAAEAGRE